MPGMGESALDSRVAVARGWEVGGEGEWLLTGTGFRLEEMKIDCGNK